MAEQISRKLKQLLKRHEKIGQADLAKRIGIPTMVLNRAIRGESTPTVQAVVKIAKYFDITTDELLGVQRRQKSA